MITAILVLGIGTFVMRMVGPLLAGGRELPPAVTRLTDLLPAAMLAALVASQTVFDGTQFVLDARLVGVAAAGVAVLLRAPFAVVVLVGAGITALVRLVA